MKTPPAQLFRSVPTEADGFRIRIAGRGDIEAVIAMSPEKFNGVAMSVEGKRRILGEVVRHGAMVVAEAADGAVVGNCVLGSRSKDGPIELGWAVAHESRGRGVASAMMETILDRLFAGGVEAVNCTVEPDNAASLRIAEKLGFQPADPHSEGLLSFRLDRNGFEDRPTMAPTP